jgi:hypothetical protein
MEKSYETQTQFPEWNIVEDGEPSISVGFRMAVIYSPALEHNKDL